MKDLEKKRKDVEEKINDLKARWPSHSVKPAMVAELEELELELEELIEKLKKGREDED